MDKLICKQKHFTDNEPYCPACGKEMSPLYLKTNNIKVGSLSWQPIYCRNCKEIYIKNGIWFGVQKYYDSELEVEMIE